MKIVLCDVFAAAAAIQRAERALACGARAFGAAGAGGEAISAVLLIRASVEAAVGAQLVKLSIEQVGVADACAVFAQRILAAWRVTGAAGILVVFDIDATIAAIQRAGRALTSTADATARTTAVVEWARVTQESTARVAVAGAAATVFRIAVCAQRSGR